MSALADKANELSWYHTIDLGEGVVTPGFFDTRATVQHVPLPDSLAGKRCLDVGTWDGFWAFELERRGAESVTAVDIEDADRWDWPPQSRIGAANADRLRYLAEFKSGGRSFALARDALGSRVERVDCSIYELSPDRVGTFDFAFLGSLLLHLRDPVGALAALRSVCAGFEILERSRLYYLPVGAGHPPAPLLRSLRNAVRSAEGREKLIIRLKGIPHVAFRVRPVSS
jgi:tRNA (mo5U34)-methyltransferase